MPHPYVKFEGTALWHALDEEIASLEENGDVKLTTARQYVIGSLCKRLASTGLATLIPLEALPITPDGKGAALPVSDATKQGTVREWRDLGFYYDRDDQAKEWILIGSRAGLLRFRDLLLAYAANVQHTTLSEHEHYGPYSYLKVMTAQEPGFDQDAIYGSLADLSRLARLVHDKLTTASHGAHLYLREDFSPQSPYDLVLSVREDEFDPPAADPVLGSMPG